MNSTLVAATSNDVSATPSSSANVTNKSNSSTNATSLTVASVMVIAIPWFPLLIHRDFCSSFYGITIFINLTFRIFIGIRYFCRFNPRDDFGWEFHHEDVPSDVFNDVEDSVDREETLLTIDQVNQLFPISKYNIWKANQKESLDNAGATSVVILPAASGAAMPMTDESRSIGFEPPSYSPAPSLNQLDNGLSTNKSLTSETSALSSNQSNIFDSFNSHKKVGGVPSMRNISKTSKDNCAICIEAFDDNDDVRGLACGHCYHQKCIDPWLTNCRGACPLCNVDYYPLNVAENSTQSSVYNRRAAPRTSNFLSHLSNERVTTLRSLTTPGIRSPPLALASYTPTESGRSRWMSTPRHFSEGRLGNSERSLSRLEQGGL